MATRLTGVSPLAVVPLFLVSLCLFFGPSPTYAGEAGGDISRRIDALVQQGGYIVTRDSRIVSRKNGDTLFMPASILKVATSLAAYRLLGEDFRFETRFYLTDNDDLFIKGYGDPYLTSEEISLILTNLEKRGIRRINDIILDAGAFAIDEAADGSGTSANPYDAQNSALAANFNTINLEKLSSGTIRSAEPQTPTLPLMLRLGAPLPPGRHRLNISADRKDILVHTGELFRTLQERRGISGEGTIRSGSVTPDRRAVYIHRSTKSLAEIIRGLLLYSNNYIANQLFLTCGAKQLGYPATWEKARRTMKAFLASLGLDGREIHMEEGSGLSRQNRVSPEAMVALLNEFAPHADLFPRHQGHLVKSGTLTGVYSYAGYFLGDRPDPFVLILNQKKNTRDQLLNLLEKIYRQP